MGDAKAAGVLVVDDDDSLRELLEEAVRDWGYDVSTACSGEEALESIERKKFNIVICDLKMPGMDGLELLKKIKASDKKVHVIVITGFATLETVIKTIEAGAFDYITKPFRIEELRRIMKKAGPRGVMAGTRQRLFEKLNKAYGRLDVMRAIQRNSADEPG